MGIRQQVIAAELAGGVTVAHMAAMHGDVLAHEQSGDGYAGNDVALLADEGRVGVLVAGYGSCSSCDELRSIDEIDDSDARLTELVAYAERLGDQVRWFDSAADARRWVADPRRVPQWWDAPSTDVVPTLDQLLLQPA